MEVVKVIFTPHDSMIIVLDAFARLGPSYHLYHGQVSPDFATDLRKANQRNLLR